MTQTHQVQELDPFGLQLIDNPYPTYARFLECGPFFHTQTQMWIVSRYADVRHVLRDAAFGKSSVDDRVKTVFGDGPVARSFRNWLLFRNPPDHTRLRALVAQAFTPRSVSLLNDQIQCAVNNLLDRALQRGTFDLIGDFALPLPVLVISALLGVPDEDREDFRRWSMTLSQCLDALSTPLPDVVIAGNAAASDFTEYFSNLLAHRRTRPGPDLLSSLITAESCGDRLSTEELLGTCVLLFFAGHETTVNLIGNGVLTLLQHPDQMRCLRQKPALVANAVDEMLRYDGPVQRLGRSTDAGANVGGVDIRSGERIHLLIGAANRDPRRFQHPHQFDIARPDAAQHLTFGGGIHYCVGAPLARLEAQIAIATLLRRAPDLHLSEDAPVVWRRGFVMRGLTELALTVGRPNE